MESLGDDDGDYRLSFSVSDLSNDCLTKFNQGASLCTSQTDAEVIRNRIADFKLWADGVGAMARKGLSLEKRFEHRPRDLNLVKNVLIILSQFLDEVVSKIGTDGSRKSLDNVESSIKNLALIGMAIRQTGKASRRRRADATYDPAKYRQLRQHLECIVLLRPGEGLPGLEHIADESDSDSIMTEHERLGVNLETRLENYAVARLGGLERSNLSVLQNRLIEANLRRRHRFKQAQGRSQRTNIQPAEPRTPTTDESRPLTESPQTHDSASLAEASSPTPNKADMTRASINSRQESDPTTAEGSMGDPLLAKATRKVTPSQISSIGAECEFPKPPIHVPGRLVTRCPCCCQSLPVNVTSSPTAWRQHLIEDLSPYTCIAEHCPSPHVTFASKKAWNDHFQKKHPFEWQCVMCDEEVVFTIRENMESHVAVKHQDDLVDCTVSDIISWSAVQSVGVQACPLCSSYGPKDSPELVDHVLQHAYDFALRSFPWSDIAPETLGKPLGTYNLPADEEDAERLTTWIQSTNHGDRMDLHLCSYDDTKSLLLPETNLHQEGDYFAVNDYFQDQSRDGSLRAQSDKYDTDESEEETLLYYVQLLLDNGADINAQGGYFGNALQAAVSSGNEELVQLLLDSGAKVRQGGDALRMASSRGYEKTVQLLLNNGAHLNAQSESLQIASSGGHEKIVQLLLDNGSDLNAQRGAYGTALEAACSKGYEKIVQLLLDSGAEVRQGSNALQMASSRGHEKIVQLLLDNGADVNTQSVSQGNALQAACFEGHEKLAQLLLDSGADVRQVDHALQMASFRGHEKVVQLLLDNGADVNAHCEAYGTTLQAACWGGQEKLVQLLLDNGADVNKTSEEDDSALQMASSRGHEKIVQLLLDHGADPVSPGRLS
ncbi:ankyrin repeat domain-containing protein 50 [Microdochium nivale]|nr:ankyrin repeat domain-containing protein 50 [Microdochium nivale]